MRILFLALFLAMPFFMTARTIPGYSFDHFLKKALTTTGDEWNTLDDEVEKEKSKKDKSKTPKLKSHKDASGLDDLLRILQQNSDLTVTLSANFKLPTNNKFRFKRSEFIYKYLFQNGIEESRMNFQCVSYHTPYVFSGTQNLVNEQLEPGDIIFGIDENKILEINTDYSDGESSKTSEK